MIVAHFDGAGRRELATLPRRCCTWTVVPTRAAGEPYEPAAGERGEPACEPGACLVARWWQHDHAYVLSAFGPVISDRRSFGRAREVVIAVYSAHAGTGD